MTFITRDVPGVGQQQFLHYRTDPVNVELTMPTADQYRLAALPDAIIALERIRQILPVSIEDEAISIQQTIEQEVFFQIKSWAENGNQSKAEALLQENGFSAESARQLIKTIRSPMLGGTIAFMEVVDQEIVDGRNLALVQDDEAAWIIQQVVPGETALSVETVTAAAYSATLLETLNSLLEQ
jgi:hypothetical protein